jgi:glycosyltransferase involved in cell wall biosynthesis
MNKKNKKVLYITYDGMTDQLGQSQVIPYLQILSKQGYAITLLSTEKKEKLRKDKPLIEKILAESGIIWQPILFSRRPPLLSKMYDQWKLNRKAAALYKKEKFDFIHCRSYVPAAAAIRLYHRYGVPYLFDMRGFWVDERVDNGQWDTGNFFYKKLYKAYKKKEKEYLEQAAYIITLTHKGKRELINAYQVPEIKISVIPCCADLEFFNYQKINNAEKDIIREKLCIGPGVKILTYLGSLGGWYLTGEMLDFFKVLSQKENSVIFLFITHDNKEEILKQAQSKGIDEKAIRVMAAGRKDVPLFLSISNWSVFFIKDAYSKKASSPTKQGEIMAMGIPVICNDIGDTGLITEQSGSGIVVRKFNLQEYERVAESICNENKFDKETIRQSSFKYYNLQNAGKEYAEIYHLLSQQ